MRLDLSNNLIQFPRGKIQVLVEVEKGLLMEIEQGNNQWIQIED